MTRLCAGSLILTAAISIAASEGKAVPVRAVMHVGAAMTTPYSVYLTAGPTLSGGIRIGRRHTVEAELWCLMIPGGVADARSPQTAAVLDFAASYYISPLVLRDLVRVEAGVRIATVRNEYREWDGYLAIPARISLGGCRTAWYVSGMVSLPMLVDLFGGYMRYATAPAAFGTGVRIAFGCRSWPTE